MNKVTFLLDLDDERLWQGSMEVPLSPKEFQLLRFLAQRPNCLVKKEDILNEIWPDTCISEGLIKDYVRHLRKALGDDSKRPQYIETVHRRGYRFIGRMTVVRQRQAASAWPPAVGMLSD